MGNPSSSIGRNSKCSVCGLELIDGKCPGEKKYDPRNKNHYLIAKFDGFLYWTNSVFWRDFFK